MSGLGGFAPLPLRLGAGPETSITAEQWSRLCADLVACVATCPFAVLLGNTNSTTIDAYEAMHAGGTANAPTVTINSSGDISIEWEAGYSDEHEAIAPVVLKSANAQAMSLLPPAFATAEVVSRNEIRVRTRNYSGALTATNVFVVVY